MNSQATNLRRFLIVGFLALTSSTATGADWIADYGVAFRAAREQRKPLLVVLERPTEARFRIEQVSASAGNEDSALLRPYTLCRIDVTTKHGKKMAELFRVNEFPQIAITDNQVDQVIFRRQGKISDLDWATMLVSYRKGTRPVIEPLPASVSSPFRSSSRVRPSSNVCYT